MLNGQSINEAHASTMDMAMLREVEGQSKILKIQKSQVYENMLSFCRESNDPMAQDINRRLDVIQSEAQIYEDMLSFCRESNDPVAHDINFRLDIINAASDILSLDIDQLHLMYENTRHRPVASHVQE